MSLKGYKQSEEHIKKKADKIRKITKEKQSMIKQKYLIGINTRELAEEFNCSQPTICTHLDLMGIKRRKSGVNKGNTPWNKGKKGLQVSWCKGTKGLIKSNKKGKSLEEIYDKEIAKKMRKQLKENRKHQKFPKKDSKIEVKIQKFLKLLGFEFYSHQYMNIKHGYQCDIFIPAMNLVIECDGDYWHRYPTGRDIDHVRTNELIGKGFKVLRLWEHEIKPMKLNNFEEKLKNVE